MAGKSVFSPSLHPHVPTMPDFKHILAATDLSAPARHAVERAALLARQLEAQMEVVHVADLTPLEKLRHMMGVGPEELKERVATRASEKLDELRFALHKRLGELPMNAHVEFGSLLPVLGEYARNADLLVCGSRGESFMRHLLLGSTAERLLNTAACPVLVVKQPMHEPYRNVLVPVDFSKASLQAIRHAQQIAPGAELVLLHVYEVPFAGYLRYASVEHDTFAHYRDQARQEATQKLQALRDDAGLPLDSTRLLVLQGDPVMRIVEQEQEQYAELVVLGKHGENALTEMLLGSVTKRVLTEVQSDVLISV